MVCNLFTQNSFAAKDVLNTLLNTLSLQMYGPSHLLAKNRFPIFYFLILIVPFAVNNIPFLAFLVGITQSNISIPNAIFSNILIGVPTPIKYLGLSSGKIAVTTSVMAYISSAGSPTDNPPIAFPCAPAFAMYSADCWRKSLYVLP